MLEMLEAAEQLRTLLVGRFYSCFSVANNFDLDFDGFHLTAQDVTSPDEALVNSSFVSTYLPARHTANPEYIGKCAILGACLGTVIKSVELAADASLILELESGVVLKLNTATPVVDWHWAITESGGDPYLGCMIACFAPGEVQGCIANKSFKPNPLRGSA